MDTVNALTFRQKFGEIIDRVVKTGSPIVIERQNEPLAVLYPYHEKSGELSEKIKEQKRKLLIDMVNKWANKWGTKKISGGKDTTSLIREMRDNRYGKRWWITRSND